MSDPLLPDRSNGTSPESTQPDTPSPATQRAMKKLFILLLILGLSIGAIASIGVVAVIQRLGLNDVPAQVETP